MEFLYLLEGIRFPILDKVMLLITALGEETAFLVVALIVFWCVDKNRGYYILGVGFFGTILNQTLKLLCRIPRPWVLDKDFTIVEQARETATGYSFPSGHSQNAVGIFGGVAVTEKNRVLRWILIAVAVLVPFSRMYLGVHTPADVLAGALCALVLILAFRFLKDGKYIPQTVAAMAAVSALFLLFVTVYPFPADMDPHNYASGVKNAYTLLGATLGLLLAYFLDKKWVHFEVKALWWVQIIKVVAGLALVLLVKEGLRDVLGSLFGEYPGRAVRYFLIVVVAGAVFPLSFRWFSQLGKKES